MFYCRKYNWSKIYIQIKVVFLAELDLKTQNEKFSLQNSLSTFAIVSIYHSVRRPNSNSNVIATPKHTECTLPLPYFGECLKVIDCKKFKTATFLSMEIAVQIWICRKPFFNISSNITIVGKFKSLTASVCRNIPRNSV